MFVELPLFVIDFVSDGTCLELLLVEIAPLVYNFGKDRLPLFVEDFGGECPCSCLLLIKTASYFQLILVRTAPVLS